MVLWHVNDMLIHDTLQKLQWDTKSEPLNLVFTLKGWLGRGIQHRIDIQKDRFMH
jgi:hypothetical protein